jgi:Ca2+-binding EF-hand superfamily protein
VLGMSEEITEFFIEADENADGVICYEEFCVIMRKMFK